MKNTLRFDVVGDPRPVVVPRAAYRIGTSDEGRSWYRGADAGAEWRFASRFSTSMALATSARGQLQLVVGQHSKVLKDNFHHRYLTSLFHLH